MHRFLTAFLCLSTLAMTQNVVAGTPTPFPALETRVRAAGMSHSGLEVQASSQAPVGGEIPSAGTMMLFVTGLAGLSAVGGRGRAGKSAARS